MTAHVQGSARVLGTSSGHDRPDADRYLILGSGVDHAKAGIASGALPLDATTDLMLTDT
jgi:hypothetical protein